MPSINTSTDDPSIENHTATRDFQSQQAVLHTKTPHSQQSQAGSTSSNANINIANASPTRNRQPHQPATSFLLVADSSALKHPVPTSSYSTVPRSCRFNYAADKSFLDSATPVDEMSFPSRQHVPVGTRDSHDLSLSPRQVTRDSLVTTMLLSLDQMGLDQFPSPPTALPAAYDSTRSSEDFPGPDVTRARTWSDHSGRRHGHSMSSDMESIEEPGRVHASRTRRSNSSSNFHSAAAAATRKMSLREPLHRAQQPPSVTPGPSHTRGGRPRSKNSSGTSTSIDAGYSHVTGGQRWAQGGSDGRSTSFDQGELHANPRSQWHVEFSQSFLADEYDAAPMPTVPGGPRRVTAPMMPQAGAPVHQPPPDHTPPMTAVEPSPNKKNNTMTGRRAELRFNRRQNQKGPPPLDLDSAPAPHIGYEKSKEAPSPTRTTPHAKDRPGFFRRVFGSKASTSSNDPSQPFPNPDDAPQHIASQMRAPATSTPPRSRDMSSPPSHTQVLQKKSSSFFRRRKKSMSEYDVRQDAPPPLPTSMPVAAKPVVSPAPAPAVSSPNKAEAEADGGRLLVATQSALPSPVSSLRMVMNPYLKDQPMQAFAGETPAGDRPVTPEDDREPTRGFSPGYEPSPNAKIRAVQTGNDMADKVADKDLRRTDTPSRPPPEVPRPGEVKNNSFLDLDGASELDVESAHAEPVPEGQANLALPIEGTGSVSPASTGTGYKSVPSAPPSIAVESRQTSPTAKTEDKTIDTPLDEPDSFVIGDPTDDDRQKALKIFEGKEEYISKEKAAAWMGEEGPIRQRTLRAYMDLYDFTNESILKGLRQMCARLVFRAETQQVDRILVTFATRWCDCNPNHGFKSMGKSTRTLKRRS